MYELLMSLFLRIISFFF